MAERPLVFIGDSITDAGRREDPEGLGHGWVGSSPTSSGSAATTVRS